ncbi:MAG: patatin-like phospholipase family protein [Hyphomicrobiaceae bacterium]
MTERAHTATRPTVALALGGGSARGLAHILMLEVFDELGVVPTAIAGTSIGAIMGACYAAGLSAVEIREHCRAMLASRRAFLSTLVRAAPGHLSSLWSPWQPSVVDGVTLLEMLMPERVRCDFQSLKIPFWSIATDFYGLDQVAISNGPVIPAVAASAALPTIMRPVIIDGRVLIDGGFVNPTPYDVVKPKADFTVAVDVTGDTQRRPGIEVPSTVEAWIGATQILFHSITREKLKTSSPEIFIRPNVGGFSTLDFLRMDEILAAATPAKDELKRRLAALLERPAMQ